MKEIKNISFLPPRPKEAHKGDFGRILVIAGSRGMMGAACLTTQACMRSGAGIVTLAVPASLLPIAMIKLTCAMTYPLPETDEQTISAEAVNVILNIAQKMDVVALGPGLSQHPETINMVHKLLPLLDKILVLDADGLNAVAQNMEVLKQRPQGTILTPHSGELARMTKQLVTKDQDKRLKIASELAVNYHCVVVCKGAPTIVTDGENFYVNTTGNPGMATGGSGDVLTGVIAALYAQKLNLFAAAQLGVFFHGLAGDIACRQKGEIGMIASDILDCLPDAFLSFAKF